jgi:hypothetical protein
MVVATPSLTGHSEPELSAEEIAAVGAILGGTPVYEALKESELEESKSRSLLARAIEILSRHLCQLCSEAPPFFAVPTEDLIDKIISLTPEFGFRERVFLLSRHCQRMFPVCFRMLTDSGGLSHVREIQAADRFIHIHGAIPFFGSPNYGPALIEEATAIVSEIRNVRSEFYLRDSFRPVIHFAHCIRVAAELVLGHRIEPGADWAGLDYWAGKNELFHAVYDDMNLLRRLDQTEGSPIGDPSEWDLWPAGEPAWYREAVESVQYSPKSAGSDVVAERPAETIVHFTEEPVRLRIPPIAFLRSMAVILWNALRHPCQTTEVDLSTGRVLSQSRERC